MIIHRYMMKNNKSINFFLIILSSLFLFCILIFGSFSLMINNKSFYYYEYDKNNVYNNVAKLKNINITESKIYVNNITENIFSFFKGRSELKNFNEYETSHMNDVKFIISSINFIYYSSAIFFIITFIILYLLYKNNKIIFIEHISKILIYGSSASLIFLVILFIWSVFSFESLFFLMHLTLFPRGNWMFDANSLLITLFPERFFSDMALRIFVYSIFQSIVFLLMGYWMRKQVLLYKKINPITMKNKITK